MNTLCNALFTVIIANRNS